jgi:hypothetical protein
MGDGKFASGVAGPVDGGSRVVVLDEVEYM